MLPQDNLHTQPYLRGHAFEKGTLAALCLITGGRDPRLQAPTGPCTDRQRGDGDQ